MIFKLGVTSLDALQRNRTWLGRRKRFALSLYGEIIESHPESDDWLPSILQRHAAVTGAVKRTLDRRFEELDEIVARHFARMRQTVSGEVRVHDMGVSDGRTSVELYERLCSSGPLRFVASDLYPRVDIVRSLAGGWAVVFDEDGHVVQYVAHGFVVSPVAPDRMLAYPVNRLALAAFEYHLQPVARAARDSLLTAPIDDLERRSIDGFEIWRVPLICRACLSLLRDGQIRFQRHDIRAPLSERYHLLRAMNVLNHVSLEQLPHVAAHLREGLEEGGLLVVGRSADPGNRTLATVWQRVGDRLHVIARLHGGAETADLIESGG